MTFNPYHAAPDSFFIMLAFLVIFSLLYLEQRKAIKERFAEDPPWNGKAKSEDEFLARIMVSLKRDKKKDHIYAAKAWGLAIIGSVSLFFAIVYGLMCAGII